MQNTLENNSGHLLLKSKFFIFRAVSYFSFLLIPLYVQKSLDLHAATQAIFMTMYILFIVAQWFLLGKEIDHRLKIYFRVNSSIDRIIYRIFLGLFFFVILFNLIAILPSKWIYNSFWIIWSLLGLFYSWPTRGKIIQESVSSNFGEFKFLDGFEKTLVAFILIMFVVSLPDYPPLMGNEAMKLFYDPLEKVATPFWNFLLVNYYPFKSYPVLNRAAWSLHFYVVNLGLFLLLFYAFLRYFVSRRLSLLGVFSLVSTWSFTKIFVHNIEFGLLTTYSLLWVWTMLWVSRSSTYRAGLFLGLVGYWGTIINQAFAPLLWIQLVLMYFVYLRDRTFWFRNQFLRYASFGFFLSFIVFLNHLEPFFSGLFSGNDLWSSILFEINRKAFYSLSFFGLIFMVLIYFYNKWSIFKETNFERDYLAIFWSSFLIMIFYSLLIDAHILKGFSLLWIMAFLSLIPIEVLFQSISRLRSKRNMIFLIYILICLLDSHFEGRVKIFLKIFNN